MTAATTLLTAVRSVIVAAAPSLVEVYTYAPPTINDPRAAFLYYDSYQDTERLSGGLVRRVHQIPIWLLVNASQIAEPDTAENDFLAIHDQIANAFFTNHKLGGLVGTSSLARQNGPTYIEFMGVVFRHAAWILSVQEDLGFAFA